MTNKVFSRDWLETTGGRGHKNLTNIQNNNDTKYIKLHMNKQIMVTGP